VKLTLEWPPSNNHYKRHYCTVDREHAVRARLTDQAEQYKHNAGWAAKMVRGPQEPLSGPVSVVIHAYLPTRRTDADNVSKLVFDSLNGIIWEDDKQVVDYHIYLVRGDEKNARLELSITEL
jgi:Holliday junction resolvase RusA-like endonuclease